ncbi:CTP synthase 2 [Trichomonascus vanleenenianus]|uniref:CTP synthase URA8 n=1 Tax=Trichomonascus vanleenenianus TaxID=2268995 RepID=UPI003ECAE363
MKYVVVSGGVISGIGKGVIASSTGLLLKTYGLKVTSIKIDPYMNIDAGTMSPLEHGEVFTLDDGGEVDLDLGNYERYLNVTLTRDHNITTGKVYRHVIEKERRGDYLGKTVQIVPHLTNAIQDWIERVAEIPVDGDNEKPDVCIIELGGTVGDIESAPFVEALRQFQFRVGVDNFALIHVSLVPVIHGEKKTKPTQAAIKDLRSLGLTPNLIACRCAEELGESAINKISMFCHVGPDQVLGVHDVNSTYHVPLLLEQQGLLRFFIDKFKLNLLDLSPERKQNGHGLWNRWRRLTESHDKSFETVTIAIVGKYTDLQDSYISVVKALEHSALRCQRLLKIIWIEATSLEANSVDPKTYHEAWSDLVKADGILVPGGFGTRGVQGMIEAAKWARENKVPYLGICLGFQVGVIEYVRNVMGRTGTHSMEFDETNPDPCIVYMPEVSRTHLGGTMRLGLRPSIFQEGTEDSKLRRLYGGREQVMERHRHRYEVNPKMVPEYEKAGLRFVAKDETGERMEVFELKDHPYMVGCQYHPEYLSRVLEPSEPVLGLVAAASKKLEAVMEAQCKGSEDGVVVNGDF